jgi:hypothetical protein
MSEQVTFAFGSAQPEAEAPQAESILLECGHLRDAVIVCANGETVCPGCEFGGPWSADV